MTEAERKEYGERMSECASGYTWSDESKKRFSELQQTKPNGATYTIEQVREVRRLHEEEGLGYAEIAERLNMGKKGVYMIATYRRWKNAV